MSTTHIAEIHSYLKHQDISLAVRRMLDLSLDTGDKTLIRESIQWSKTYNQHQSANTTAPLPAQFFEAGYRLIEKASQIVPPAIAASKNLVTATDIAKTYSAGNFSLKPVSLSVNNGNIIGVVGENGNGKTTLLRCIAGQLALDKGTIEYSLLQNPDYYAVKNYVVFIPQRIPRWYGQLKDNLHFSASIAGITGDENELMVEFMLERLNLSSFANLNWNQISSGYRTRFELARVLLQKPQLLILDEPLANLDINAQQTILNDLRFIAKSTYNPMGVLLSSQQLHEVEKVADSVLFIKQGTAIIDNLDKGQQNATSYALELESADTRERMAEILGEAQVQIQFNGGFYTLVSSSVTVAEMIKKLMNSGVSISYFRDITYSTKRYFN